MKGIVTKLRAYVNRAITQRQPNSTSPIYNKVTIGDYNSDSINAFASDHYQTINQARLEHLQKLNLPLENRVVLDVGSGPGDLAQFFAQRGNRVICVDGRHENIERMATLYPNLEGHVADVQIPNALDKFGMADIVFCYGLLYHVENPMQVIRNMASVCKEMLLLSTMVCDSNLPIVYYATEENAATQALAGVGCRPSESFIVMALRIAGFEYVYRPNFLPNHPQYQYERINNLEWNRNHIPLRGIFVASRAALNNQNLTLLR